MKFTIVVYAAPAFGEAAASAYRFSKAVLESGHDIHRLFFFGEGVHNANRLIVPPQDEANLPQQWQELIKSHELESVVCVSSAIRRGILDVNEAERYELEAVVREGFEVAGLGELVSATMESDRVISFG